MFKFISVLCLIVASCHVLAAPADDSSVVVVNSWNEPYGGEISNGYKFGYELSDGQKRSEVGSFVRNRNNVDALQVQGSYSFNSPEGESFTIDFVADENGYRPRLNRVAAGGKRIISDNEKYGVGKIDNRFATPSS